MHVKRTFIYTPSDGPNKQQFVSLPCPSIIYHLFSDFPGKDLVLVQNFIYTYCIHSASFLNKQNIINRNMCRRNFYFHVLQQDFGGKQYVKNPQKLLSKCRRNPRNCVILLNSNVRNFYVHVFQQDFGDFSKIWYLQNLICLTVCF